MQMVAKKGQLCSIRWNYCSCNDCIVVKLDENDEGFLFNLLRHLKVLWTLFYLQTRNGPKDISNNPIK